MGIAEPSQFIIDELAAVVRVQELDWERQVREDTGESSKHNNLRTAGDRDNLRLSRTAIRDGEGVAMVSCFLPSIMTHEVHLHVPGDSSREFPGRDDGNESQQTPWFCSGSMPPVPPLAFSSLSRRSVPIPEVGNPGKGREDQCILLLCAGKHVPQRLSVCHTSLPRALLSLASFCPRCECSSRRGVLPTSMLVSWEWRSAAQAGIHSVFLYLHLGYVSTTLY